VVGLFRSSLRQGQSLLRRVLFYVGGLTFLPAPADVGPAHDTARRGYRRREKPKKEKWGRNNVFTNNVEAPSYMVNLPENGKLKEQIFEGLRPILEEWSGVS